MTHVLPGFQILKNFVKFIAILPSFNFMRKDEVFLIGPEFQDDKLFKVENISSDSFNLVEYPFYLSIQPIRTISTIIFPHQQVQVSISNYPQCGLLFYCVYFRLFIDQMAETEQKQKYLEETGEKPQDRDEENAQDSLSQAYMTDDVDSEDFDLESTYLNRLRIQRKRIEELSLSLTISKEKYEEEVSLRKSLEAELEKFHSGKVSSYRIEEIHLQMTTVQEENQRLSTQTQQLKRDIVDIRAQCEAKLARMATEANNQRRKDLAKIEALQEQLSEKQDEVERLQKQLKYKERQLNEASNQSSSKVSKLKEQYEERLKVQQRKVEKFQQQKVMKSSNGQDIETQLSFAVKEVERLKDENSKLGKYIEERERELLHQVEKYKAKLNALKKDLRAKEKDYDDLKASHVKFEREKKDQASEREELKVQVTKITEEYQTVLVRKENDFYVEKRNMKATIDEQGKAIGELMATRQKYLARIRQLEAILKRNDDAKHHRKMLLKDELREIEKLQKVIDRIVE